MLDKIDNGNLLNGNDRYHKYFPAFQKAQDNRFVLTCDQN